MKQEAVHEHKHINTIKKHRDKVIRSRNKRRCKRKKPNRVHKRFCNVKESVHHGKMCKGNIYGFAPRIHTIPVEAPPVRVFRADVRIKCAQNIWIRTYQKILKWQSYHQMNYRHLCFLRSKTQNGWFRSQQPANGLRNSSFADHYINKNDKLDPYGDTDNEDSDDSNVAEASRIEKVNQSRKQQKQGGQTQDTYKLDEEFLAFMEVSARHRFEHRKLKSECID